MRAHAERVDRALRRLERGEEALARLRHAVCGTLPLADAEALMDDIGDHLDAVGAKLNAAQDIINAEFDRIFNSEEAAR